MFTVQQYSMWVSCSQSKNTPQLHTKMCLADFSRHAHKTCSSGPLRVSQFWLILRCLTHDKEKIYLALFWLILRCLTHDKEKIYSSCPKVVIPLAQVWSSTHLKKMLHAQEQVWQPYWICRISWGVLMLLENSVLPCLFVAMKTSDWMNEQMNK